MVAEEKVVNVFICVLQLGKFLQMCFFLFQARPQSELTLEAAKVGEREGRQQGGKGFPFILLSWIQSLPHLAQYSLCFTHLRPPPCLLTGEL